MIKLELITILALTFLLQLSNCQQKALPSSTSVIEALDTTNKVIFTNDCIKVDSVVNIPDSILLRYEATTADVVYYQSISDSFRKVNDSIVKDNKYIAARLLHSELIISNVKYYLNICIRNPTQDKFLKGWIKRAVQ